MIKPSRAPIETETLMPFFDDLHVPHPNEKTKAWKLYHKRHRAKTNRTNMSPSLKRHAKVEHKLTPTHEDVQLGKRGRDGYYTCG